ncbi:3607_t:CDS:2 [Paraglomus occultum]|uniref:3607_t:CDS:1 n=1 Tax=Paraglomus occultum TaxID=144539 RepID=A0A9N9BNM0_9GLOM|nr:3607_t:CDS:2 [Paraglomus occultum]
MQYFDETPTSAWSLRGYVDYFRTNNGISSSRQFIHNNYNNALKHISTSGVVNERKRALSLLSSFKQDKLSMKSFWEKEEHFMIMTSFSRREKRALAEADTETIVDNYDITDEEKVELCFDASEIQTIQESTKRIIERSTNELETKLLTWQHYMLKKIESGVNRPRQQNIHMLLAASSIFYFRRKNEQAYVDHLTVSETSQVKSFVVPCFERIEIPDDIKLFVDTNKKKFRRDALEDLEIYVRECSGKQHGSYVIKTFYRLLEEYVLWDFSVNMEKLTEGTYIVDYLGPIFNKTIHYFNYVTTHSWISVESNPSKLRKSPASGRVPDYMLHNKDNTRTAVYLEVTSPRRESDDVKIHWDIYRGSIHAKDSVDFDIKKYNIQPSSGKKIIIFIKGYKMVVCVMKLQYPGIYLLVEVADCTIPKSIRDLEHIMKLHQILISIRENAIDYLDESGNVTPDHTNYWSWIKPTANTPSKTKHLPKQ